MADESNKLVETCKKIVAAPAFNQFILALIVLSGVLIGMETYPRFDVHTEIGWWIQRLQDVILWLFVAEAAIKIIACWPKPWDYFRNPWNIFDFTIIAVSLLPFGGRQYVMVFRMARLLRALRLLTMLPRLQILVSALLKSIPALGYVGILLLLHFYIYAVMGTFLFRENDPVRFGNLQRSMLSLFQVVTLEGWNDVLHTQMFGSKVIGDDGTKVDYYPDAWQKLPEAQNRVPKGHPVAAPLFFVSFIMLGTMIMLNLFTGVIIGSMQEAEDQSSGKVADEVEAHIKELEEKGFLTLREELELVAHKLKEVADDVAALNEHTRGFRPNRVAATGDRAAGGDGG
jgi:voltage-gated sodium channel